MDSGSTSVFGQLKSLARRLDQGTVDLKKKVDDPQKYADDVNSANAMKHLREMLKGLQSLREEARQELGKLRQSNTKMAEVLELLPLVMEAQREALTKTENHLTQYGYTPQEKKPALSEQPTEDEDEEDEGTQSSHTTEQDTPPVKKPPSECRTPRLEDFGLSTFTLNKLMKGGTSQPTGVYTVNSQVNETDESPTPLSFKHNGLLVTPSLLGGRAMPTETPDCTRIGGLHFGMPPISLMEESPFQHTLQFPNARCGLPFTDMGSPIPPVLRTPGAKQICKTLYQEVNKKKKEEDFDSPIPPLMMTPGAKQIKKNLNKRPPSPPPRSRSILDEEPEMPQLTMSLDEITQLTQSFRLEQSTLSVPNRATPPMPELLSTKLSQSDCSKGDNSQNFSVRNVLNENTPPPPKLLGKYSFMSTQENIPPNGL